MRTLSFLSSPRFLASKASILIWTSPSTISLRPCWEEYRDRYWGGMWERISSMSAAVIFSLPTWATTSEPSCPPFEPPPNFEHPTNPTHTTTINMNRSFFNVSSLYSMCLSYRFFMLQRIPP